MHTTVHHGWENLSGRSPERYIPLPRNYQALPWWRPDWDSSLSHWMAVLCPISGADGCRRGGAWTRLCQEQDTENRNALEVEEKFGRKATYKKLVSVFWKLPQLDLVAKLCEVLMTKSSDDVSANTRSSLALFAQYLRGRYTSFILPSFFTLQWTPTPTRTVLKLAVIGHETIQRGPIDEELVRLALGVTLTASWEGILYWSEGPPQTRRLESQDLLDRRSPWVWEEYIGLAHLPEMGFGRAISEGQSCSVGTATRPSHPVSHVPSWHTSS